MQPDSTICVASSFPLIYVIKSTICFKVNMDAAFSLCECELRLSIRCGNMLEKHRASQSLHK